MPSTLAVRDWVVVGIGVVPATVVWVILGLVACFSVIPETGEGGQKPVWLSRNPVKRSGEVFFLNYSVFWICWFGTVVVSGVWRNFGNWSYLFVTSMLVVPPFVLPLLQAGEEETSKNAQMSTLCRLFWFKANVWVAILSFIGNYFWTHYFYSLLGVSYSLDGWRLNNVPVPMYLATHSYFLSYHVVAGLVLRRWRTSRLRAASPAWLRPLGSFAVVSLLASSTALTEAVTISGYDHYVIADRKFFYTVGSVVYGMALMISFPMFSQLDEPSSGCRLCGGSGDLSGAALAAGAKEESLRAAGLGSTSPRTPLIPPVPPKWRPSGAPGAGGSKPGGATPPRPGLLRSNTVHLGPGGRVKARPKTPTAASSLLGGLGLEAGGGPGMPLSGEDAGARFGASWGSSALRIDCACSCWSLGQTVLHACATGMLVLLAFDAFRLIFQASPSVKVQDVRLPWLESVIAGIKEENEFSL